MVTYCLNNLYHSYIYRRSRYLSAGSQYIFETRDLRRLSSSSADTYMYLVRNNQIVVKNDDHIGRASMFAYQPTVSGYYTLIIRAYSKYSRGKCDVYQTTNGNVSKLSNNAYFGGTPIWAHWKSDERIETNNGYGDTYLLLICGNQMLMDDDGGAGLYSKIRPGFHGYGIIVHGSYSHSSRGRANLCNYYQSYLSNPGGPDLIDDPKIIISDNMAKFQNELMKYKSSLQEMPLEKRIELTVQEQDETVKNLRDKILSEDEIKLFEIRDPPLSKEYESASNKYEKILEEAEKKLKDLAYRERAAEMAKIAVQKRTIFENIVPQEW